MKTMLLPLRLTYAPILLGKITLYLLTCTHIFSLILQWVTIWQMENGLAVTWNYPSSFGTVTAVDNLVYV